MYRIAWHGETHTHKLCGKEEPLVNLIPAPLKLREAGAVAQCLYFRLTYPGSDVLFMCRSAARAAHAVKAP